MTPAQARMLGGVVSSSAEHKCLFCGCTELAACVLNWGGLTIGCWWVNEERDVCSSPQCVKQYSTELVRKMTLLMDMASRPTSSIDDIERRA
jgi:hypothetical protein